MEKFESSASAESINEAAGYIMGIMNDVNAMGGNDSELPELNRLLKGVIAQKISPSEGRQRAKEILDRKQAYH